jgi:hypothetical protein
MDQSLGDGADAAALVLANALSSPPSSLGSPGSGLGFNTVQGIGVVIGTYPEPGSPPTLDPKGAGYGWIGVTDGWNAQTDQYNWLGGVNLPAELGGVQNNPLGVTVSVTNGALSVFINGTNELTLPVTLPPSLFIGFAGSTGTLFNRNEISDLRATVAGAPPRTALKSPSLVSVIPSVVGAVSYTTITLSNEGSTLTLTDLSTFQASSAWAPSLTTGPNAAVTFTPQVSPGNGADGIAVLFGAPSVPDSTLGSNGWGLGFAPVVAPTYAVVFSEDKENLSLIHI